MTTIGILGGGQLAQLLAIAAYQLGIKTLCFVDQEDCPARRTSPVFVGDLKDQVALDHFAKQVDIITLENENIEISILDYLAELKPLHPSSNVIKIAQDRLLEKQFFQAHGVLTADFFPVDSTSELKTDSLNGILKTRRLGYDGKGQVRIKPNDDLKTAWDTLKQPAIFESFIDFDFEVSLLVARNQRGDIQFFPLVQNLHREGILRRSHFPSGAACCAPTSKGVQHTTHATHNTALQQQAEAIGTKVINALDYIGLLAIEFFVKDNKLIANEMAPRVHNSGHLTIEGCNVSQFEQHLRAITNNTLIKPTITQQVEMHNVIGEWPTDLSRFQHIYDYGKAPRKNRKLGHMILNHSTNDP